MRFHLLLIQVTLISFLLHSCGNSGSIAGGGSTETVGIIFCSKGEPVSDVAVLFIPADHSPNTGFVADTLCSAKDGTFNYGEISDNTYNIIYEKDELRGFHSTVKIEKGKIAEEIRDTLKLSATINGTATIRPEHDHRKIYILLLGTNQFTTPVDSAGNFLFTNVPEGLHTLKILTSHPDYGTFDTTIIVEAGTADTLEEVLVLPYIGIETPKSVIKEYDILKQEVKITWQPVVAKNLRGYHVFRRNEGDTSDAILTRYPLTDTFFIDRGCSNAMAESNRWHYSICAVSDENIIGKSSPDIPVTYKSAWEMGGSVQLNSDSLSRFGDIIEVNKDILWTVTETSPEIYVIDRNSMMVIKTILIIHNDKPVTCKLYDITLMGDGTVLVATSKGVFNLDRSGKTLFWYNIMSTCIDSDSSKYIYYSENYGFPSIGSSLIKFNVTTGMTVDTVYTDRVRKITSFDFNKGSVYALFVRYDQLSLEHLICGLPVPFPLGKKMRYNGPTDVHVKGGQISVLSSQEIRNFSQKGKYLSRTSVPDKILGISKAADNSFHLLNSKGTVNVLNRKKIEINFNEPQYSSQKRISNEK